jgi:putative oxidoreductase
LFIHTEFSMNAASSSPVQQARKALQQLVSLGSQLDVLQPVAALLARLYVAQVFFLAGLTKLRDWETTLFLFTDEYKVPVLPPAVAAVMGTGGELVLPVLLALGLFGRFGALGLLVMNVVAVISLSEIAPAALQQHILWGALLAGVAVYGPGPWSLDRFLSAEKKY